MKIGILRSPGRSILPISNKVIKKLKDQGVTIAIERSQEVIHWEESLLKENAVYEDRDQILRESQMLLSVGFSDVQETSAQYWVSEFQPFNDPSVSEKLTRIGVVGLSLDMIPRISRAQAMDVLSRSEEHTSELQSRGHLVC